MLTSRFGFQQGGVALALLLLLAFNSFSPQDTAAAGDVVPGRYIVVLRDGVDASALAARHSVRPDVTYSHALSGFAASLSPAAVGRLQFDANVLAVEADRVVRAFDQTLPTGADRVDAEENTTAAIDGVDANGGLNIDIAIIDTGIDGDHPDLRLVGGADFSRNAFRCQSKSSEDGHGHGSHVAGTAAARDNGIGVVGVAPGARLWAVKVLTDSGSGYISCVIKGVDWVTANAGTIEVANMSLGGGNSSSLCSAIAKSAAKGVVYAVAAGNAAANAQNTSPANCANVLSTSAIADFNGKGGGGAAATCRSDVDDTFANFSNFGTVVDIAAPGVCIFSTYKDGGYSTFSGTSMASPHVAGAAAVYMLANNVNPSDAAGAAAVRDGLIASGKAQTDAACGFTGDPDSSAEPLLYLGTSGTCN
jgi:subtilisin family serine protease